MTQPYDTWIEHRRDDGERVGWIRPEGDHYLPIDLLGRECAPPMEWLSAERVLNDRGIAYLADLYELARPDGSWLRVRIVEVSPEGIRVKKDDFGAINAEQLYFELPFPLMNDLLRPYGHE